jgi:hypothetical protein
MAYFVGSQTRVRAKFRRTDNAHLVDPTEVAFQHSSPDGAITTYVYPTDSEIVRDEQGIYYSDVTLVAHGVHWLRWSSSGNLVTAREKQLAVEKSRFANPR